MSRHILHDGESAVIDCGDEHCEACMDWTAYYDQQFCMRFNIVLDEDAVQYALRSEECLDAERAAEEASTNG